MYKKLILSLIVVGLALSGPVAADTFQYDDTTIHFPGWAFLPTTDAHGIPDFANGYGAGKVGAEAEITEAAGKYYLQSLEFFYGYGVNSGSSYVNLWDSLYPGDLFLSLNNPGYWTHVVKLPDSRIAGSYPINGGTYNLYSLGTARPIDNSAATVDYLIASASNYRKGHPYAVDINDLDASWIVGSVTFDGWDKPAAAGDLVSSIFTFNNLELPAGDFTFGWTQMCANDVMMGTTTIPGTEIPEPGTLLLLGTGLIGLVARRRRQS